MTYPSVHHNQAIAMPAIGGLATSSCVAAYRSLLMRHVLKRMMILQGSRRQEALTI
jgi:hypothetical protein